MQIPKDATEDTMIIRKKEIKVWACSLAQAELKFYPENPRIYSSVWLGEDEQPSQERIFKELSASEHVRETLVPSIRDNGGLIEPILVRDGIVLEGNSRLAAYRLLAQVDAAQWKYIKARVLPMDVSESEIFSLLGQYHMVGKKDWPPYEQAGYLYRRFKMHDMAVQDLSAEVGLSRAKVQHLISVFTFMVERDDRSPARWSFYDELLKGRRFDDARKLYPKFDQHIADMISSGEIPRAVDLRDDLPRIVKAGGNTLKKFMSSSLSFSEAAEDARLRGAGNYHAQKLKGFRQWINDDNMETDMRAMSVDEAKVVRFELEKIQSRAAQLIKKLTSSQKH